MFQYRPERAGVSRDLFVAALDAEGIPCDGRFYEPVYRSDLFYATPEICPQLRIGREQLAKQFLNANGEKPPGFTHVVTSAPGKMIFISRKGGAGADFATQTTNTFENLKQCLALAGADFKDVVKINYFVKDISNTPELRQIRAKYLDMDHPPAAALVQTGLSAGLLLEVEAVAMVPE